MSFNFYGIQVTHEITRLKSTVRERWPIRIYRQRNFVSRNVYVGDKPRLPAGRIGWKDWRAIYLRSHIEAMGKYKVVSRATYFRGRWDVTTLHADWYVDLGVRIVRPIWLIDDSHVAHTREYPICWKRAHRRYTRRKKRPEAMP